MNDNIFLDTNVFISPAAIGFAALKPTAKKLHVVGANTDKGKTVKTGKSVYT